MMYKNAFKLIFSNFTLVWKLLVYFVICIILGVSLSYAVSIPILNKIGITELLSGIPDAFREFILSFDMSSFLVKVQEVINNISTLVVTNIATIWPYLLIILVVSILIPSFFMNFYLMSTCNVLHFYMGSNVNFSFTASLFVSFGKNIRYNLLCLVTILPIKLITYYIVIQSFALLASNVILLRVFAPFIITAIYVILTSIRVTLFSGWVPHMMVKNTGVITGLVDGFRDIRKRLVQIFANTLGVVLTIILITVFGLLTFGVSLVITAPAAFLFIATFNMVSFYTSNGLRFYVDSNNIYAPKKPEMVENYKIYRYIV